METNLVKKQWNCRIALAGLSLISLSAFAQDVESLENGAAKPAPQESAADNSARLPISATLGVSEQFNTDVDRAGDFSITRVKLGVGVPVRLNEQLILTTTLRYEFDSYNFDKVFPWIPMDWDHINTLSAGSILQWRVNDDWICYAGGFLKASAEAGVGLNRGLTGGGLAGFSYKLNDELSLGAGLAVASQIEEDTSVLPLVTAKWKFADDWRLDVGLTDVATFGYGAELKWIFNKEWDFGLGGQYHQSRFRIVGYQAYVTVPFRIHRRTIDGVGQEEATTIYLSAAWHASPKVDFNGFFWCRCWWQIAGG